MWRKAVDIIAWTSSVDNQIIDDSIAYIFSTSMPPLATTIRPLKASWPPEACSGIISPRRSTPALRSSAGT